MENNFNVFLDSYLDAWRSSSLTQLSNLMSKDYQAREIAAGKIIDFGFDESIEGWEEGFNFAKENNAEWDINVLSVIPLRDDETLVILTVTMILQGRTLNSGHLYFQTVKKDSSNNWKIVRSYIEAGIPIDNLKRIAVTQQMR